MRGHSGSGWTAKVNVPQALTLCYDHARQVQGYSPGGTAVVGRGLFLVALVVSVFAFAGPAQASPTFLSAINISDPGQDGFEPQVAVDSTGQVHSVWTRSDGSDFRIQYSTRTPNGSWSAPVNISAAGDGASQPQIDVDPSNNLLVVWTGSDGTNLRIQAAFKPSGGSFAAPVTISDPGFDANEPQVDFDATGKAIAVWSRFDGTVTTPPQCCLRVQASTRTAGAGGTFSNETTLSEPGRDAFDAQAAAGPNVDANGVIVWTRSDGSTLRVQSARRRDVVGFPRPKSANNLRTSLAPAYNPCTSPNRNHGPALAFPSCAPPVRSSAVLTVGSPDANTFAANSASYMRFKAITGIAATEANEADVQLIASLTDVRNHPSGTDYTGSVLMKANLQITDNRNAAEQPEPGTTQSFPIQWPVGCAATASTTIGASCISTLSLNALIPGAMQEGRRSNWEIGQTSVLDAGPNGTGYASCPPTCGDGDETVFMRQAIFVP
jgi:hypothetical protein